MNCRRNHGSTGASLEICSEIWKGMVQPLRPHLPPKTRLNAGNFAWGPQTKGRLAAALSSEKKGNDEGHSGH